MALKIEQFICLSDNFGVILHDPERLLVISIDAPEEAPIRAKLGEMGLGLTHILTTHHHHDHTAGNLALKRSFDCRIIGPAAEADRIPGIDETVGDGTRFDLAGLAFEVLATPGHTAGHVVYYLPEPGVLFAGDTLFSLGCGRLFEADAATMWASLSKLMALPDATSVYCGHEYTQANARFALTIEPGNEALQQRAAEVDRLRAAGQPAVPTTIGREKATNPFLRAAEPSVKAALGMSGASDAAVFAEIRRRKDAFR